MAPLRFGLLGTGYWALNTQGTALASSPHSRLEGVWGRDADKTKAVADQLGTDPFSDVDELLARVDAVAIALPPDVQAALAVRAAGAGCHLLLDKPLALDVSLAQEVVRATAAADVAALVFFTGRFRPGSEAWLTETVEAGPWHSAQLVQYANIFQPGNPYGASPWRQERGALWDIGPHALAAVLPLMGPVTSVVARRGPAGSDTVHMVLTHAAPGHAGKGNATAADAVKAAAATATGGPSPRGAVTGPVSTISLSLTIPPKAVTSHLSLYGEAGHRVRPDDSFAAVDAFRAAIAELADMAVSGRRAHRCNAGFAAEVTQILALAESALDLPGQDF
jgi:predicted dehydrogenase